MVRKLIIACAVMGLSLGVVQAQDDMMGDEPPMHPEVILLGPPEGFEPPEDMPPLPMDDPEAAKEMMLETFFNFMDADGSGAVDLDEFHEWVIDFHMPPPPDDMGDDEGMMDGFLHAGEGDLADLNLAPECSDDLRDSEQDPQAEGIPCGDMEGNLIFRTICNMPGYEKVAISLPDGRGAGCFDIEALTGVIGFEIVNGDGDLVWEMGMGKESYRDLKLDGPGVFEVKSTGGSPDGALTIKFVDVHTGM